MTSDAPQISEREREILTLVAKGATNQQIAHELAISVNTVKVHLRNIFGKIGAASRTEATVYAITHGLVAVDQRTVLPEEIAQAVAQATPAAIAEEAPLPAEPEAIPATAMGSTAQVIHQPENPETPATRQQRSMPTHLPTRWVILGVLGLLAVVAAAVVGYTLRQPGTVATTSTAVPGPIWLTRNALPQPRADFALAAFNGSLYAIGGSENGNESPAATRYSLADNSWLPLPSKLTPATQVQAATIGGKIYVPGGESRNGVLTAFEAFDTRAQQWEQLPDLPAPRSRYALAAVEGKLYLFGGWDGSEVQGDVFVFDPGTNTWSSLAPMLTPRMYCEAAVIDGAIYVVGGESAGGPQRANERFDPFESAEGSWSTAEPLPGPIQQPAVVGLLNGMSVFDPQLKSLHQFSPESASWVTRRLADDLAISNRAAVLNSSIFVFGPSSADTSSTALSEYQGVFTTFFPSTFSNQ